MINKEKWKAMAADTGKKAKELKDHMVHAVDQNDDGKFDLQDVSAIGAAVGEAVKRGTKTLRETADQKKWSMDLKTLQPIFREELQKPGFYLPKFIQVAPRDKKHSESEACRGSVGYRTDSKGLEIIHIFRDSLAVFGLNFSSDEGSGFYYADPSEQNTYIALDEYFGYLKVARVNELQKIAQDLGAKHFRVTYKEEQTSSTEKHIKANGDAGAVAGNLTGSSTAKQFSAVEIEAENTFPGHAPSMPELKYLRRDPSIQNLVKMRMDPTSPLLHQTYLLRLSQTSGIKEDEAVKIDAFLKGAKLGGKATVASEARNENRRFLEYEVEF